MPVCLLRLVELEPYTITSKRFATSLVQTNATVLLVSQIRFDVVRPVHIDAEALKGPWHVVYVAEKDIELPSSISKAIKRTYTLWVGIPTALLGGYKDLNAKLLAARPPPLTGSLDGGRQDSSQKLELSKGLERRGAELAAHYEGAVTQLNLLHFHKGMKEEYQKYGKAFQKAGGRRGGNAKLVGLVTPNQGDSSSGKSGEGEGGWWNQVALAHYPSILHFNDMLAGPDYQEVNQRHRQKALRDTVLMCTTEFDIEKLKRAAPVDTAKL